MATRDPVGTESLDAVIESKKLAEVQSLLKALDILQTSFSSLANPTEKQDAEGRRCILHITDLKYHKAAFYFAVEGFRVHQVDPFVKYNTYIGAPLDSVIRVLNGVLEGDENCFGREWSRGAAQLKGDYSVHDGLQFRNAFKRIARAVKRYRQYLAQTQPAQ